MHLRTVVLTSAALAVVLALPPSARADQAILSRDAKFDVPVGTWVEATGGAIVLSREGIPTVVFEGGSEFSDDETVVTKISLSTSDGLGTIELLSPATLTGVTPSNWTADPVDPSSDQFTFAPTVVFRYTAPTYAKLGCTAGHHSVVTSWLHIAGTLVGSSGTKASFSGSTFPGTVGFDNVCPAEEPSGAHDAAQVPSSTALAPYVNPHPGTPGRSPTPMPSTPASPASSPTSVAMASEPTPSVPAVAIALNEPIASASPASAPADTGDLTGAAIALGIAAVVGVAAGMLFIRRRGAIWKDRVR